MKIGIGALLFEGNTFSLGKVSLEQFKENYFYEGKSILNDLVEEEVEISGAIKVLSETGCDIVPSLATHGGCGGTVSREAFDVLCKKLLDPFNNVPLDGVYLALHGAMICEGIEHPEFELLSKLKGVIGDIPVVVSFDLHAHINNELLDLCTAIIGYQTYPHEDVYETGVRSASVLLQAVVSRESLSMSMKKLSMLISPVASSTAIGWPLHDIYKRCRVLEALPNILAVSYFLLTPWAEYEGGGSAFLIITNGGGCPKEAVFLTELTEALWSKRYDLTPEVVSFAQAIELTAEEKDKPIVLSEMSDAVGAGAPGDSALVLKEYFRLNLGKTFLIQIVDPDVARSAHECGVGQPIVCRVGNKVETRYSLPVPVSGEVVSLHDGKFYYSGGIMGGTRSTVGKSAVIKSGAATIFVTSRGAYEFGDEQYKAADLDPSEYQYVVVKNPMNFWKTFAWAPRLLAIDNPGSARADLKRLSWHKCRRPFFPLDDSPVPLYR